MLKYSPVLPAGYGEEEVYRKRTERRGIRDFEVSLGVTVVSAFATALHADTQRTVNAPLPQGTLDKVMLMPIDWKSITAVAGAYAVSSALARVRHAVNLGHDVEMGQTDGLLGREPLSIATAEERREQHIRQRLGRLAATAGAGFLAYKGAQHPSPYHVFNAAIMSMGVAMAGVTYAKHKAQQYERRIRDRLLGRDSNRR